MGVGFGRQGETKTCAACGVIGSPQAATMRSTMDWLMRSPMPVPCVGRKERIEDLLRLMPGQPYAGIRYGHHQSLFFRVLRLDVSSRGPSTSSSRRCVDHEVHQHLLQLHAISHNFGRSAANSVRTDMEYRVVSPRRRTIISRMTSFTSTNSRAEYPY